MAEQIGRGRRRGLSRERIAAAAVDYVDRHGLEAFGVRRLATALNVDPMSIYNHIPGKAALLDAICEVVLNEAAAEATEAPREWRALARWVAHNYRAMAVRHPKVFPLLTTRSQQSPVALANLERLALAMREAGLDDQAIADAPLILFGFLNGYLLAVVSPGNPQIEEVVGSVPRTSYPTLAALAPLQLDFGTVQQFDRTLEVVLSGIEGRLHKGTREQQPC